MRILRRWTTASITTLLLQVTAIGSFLVFLLLQLTGCTVLFTFTPLTVAPKEEVRLPPPETVPLFTDPAIHAGVPGGRHRFAAALAAGHFSRVVATNRNVELAIGVPGAAGGAGKVVRILKNAAGAQSVDEILADAFPVLGDKSRFGAALAAGDFDGDGFDDLAIGAPDYQSTGAVALLYGGNPAGLGVLRPPRAEGRRGFGSALVVTDLNGDGFADLVIGEPGTDRAGVGDPARVWIVWGRPAEEGLLSLASSTRIEIPAGDEQDNSTLFGSSLALGNFIPRRHQAPIMPTRPDIAIGAPKFDRPDRRDVGRVYVFEPLSPDPKLDGFGLAATLEPRNGWEAYAKEFGHALAAGNFNGDRLDGEDAIDLAIGAPASSVPEHDGLDTTFGQPSGRGRQPGAGLVFIAPYRRDTGVSAPLRVLSQERMGLSQKSDNFGWALAGGDFNRDGVDDLAIGSPNERMAAVFGLNGVSEAGAIYFRFGNAGDWDALADPGGIPQIPVACFDYIDAVRGGAAAAGDRFGSVLLAAFFDDDTAIDLIVGAPDTDVASAGGVVKDAGALWIGLNRETRPGPFEGEFVGEFRDDACGGDDPASMTMTVRNREDAVCGVLRTSRLLCFTVAEDTDASVQVDVSVLAGNLDDPNRMHLEYVLLNGDGKSVGTLFVDAAVQDAESDLTLDLRFVGSGDAKDVERSVEDLVLERQ